MRVWVAGAVPLYQMAVPRQSVGPARSAIIGSAGMRSAQSCKGLKQREDFGTARRRTGPHSENSGAAFRPRVEPPAMLDLRAVDRRFGLGTQHVARCRRFAGF